MHARSLIFLSRGASKEGSSVPQDQGGGENPMPLDPEFFGMYMH